MRISDWSSDVCSSDLPDQRRSLQGGPFITIVTAEKLHELNDEFGPFIQAIHFQQRLLGRGIEGGHLAYAINQRLIIQLRNRIPVDGVALRLCETTCFLLPPSQIGRAPCRKRGSKH